VTAALTFTLFFVSMNVHGSEGGLLAAYATLRNYLVISVIFMFVTTSFVANVVIRVGLLPPDEGRALPSPRHGSAPARPAVAAHPVRDEVGRPEPRLHLLDCGGKPGMPLSDLNGAGLLLEGRLDIPRLLGSVSPSCYSSPRTCCGGEAPRSG
jgi:hypothetical protein